MKRRIAVFLVVPLLMFSVLATSANAGTSAKFDWHISDAFISAGTGLTQTGAQSQAANGDIVRISGSGTFNMSSGKANGGGVFAHTTATGELVAFGSWQATGAPSFDLFGCGGGGFPPNFCGGVLTLDVHIKAISVTAGPVELDGVLVVQCGIAGPPGAEEGVTLEIPGVINFDTILFGAPSGLTLFVARSKS
jgi:hypothetical protein